MADSQLSTIPLVGHQHIIYDSSTWNNSLQFCKYLLMFMFINGVLICIFGQLRLVEEQ